MSSCGENEDNEGGLSVADTKANIADDIVQQSIEKHGGWDSWQNLKSISYSKTIILFDSAGMVESKVTQKHNYKLIPELKGTIEWVIDADTMLIKYSEDEAQKFINGKPDPDPESAILAKNSFFSAFYVLFQPFKLMDEGTQLNFIGADTLENNLKVNIVQPVYKGATSEDDRWWYYFDEQTNLLAANMVNHGTTFSLIVNLEYDSTTTITFNAHRKSFFVDSLRNVNYLKAEYFYEDYIIETTKK